jgi:hypothetical protein
LERTHPKQFYDGFVVESDDGVGSEWLLSLLPLPGAKDGPSFSIRRGHQWPLFHGSFLLPWHCILCRLAADHGPLEKKSPTLSQST